MTARKVDNKGPRIKRDKFEARGVTYRLIEQDAEECSELAAKFTHPAPNGEEETDMDAFQAALAVKSLVSPKVSLSQFNKYPNSLKRTLMQRAYLLSYRIEEVKELPIDDDEDWDDLDDGPGEAAAG